MEHVVCLLLNLVHFVKLVIGTLKYTRLSYADFGLKKLDMLCRCNCQ